MLRPIVRAPEAGFALLLLLGTVECEPQAANRYGGESLLSMIGRVELALERDAYADLRSERAGYWALAARRHGFEIGAGWSPASGSRV